MNASTTSARALVAALVTAGVREVVLSPGSRSAPLAYALHDAEAAGLIALHVRHDERAAGFTALGLSLAGTLAAVVTTSGTAVANLHPAVLEASEAGVPLVVLTADRPHRLRGTWANQTTALQPGIFGAGVRFAADLQAGGAAWPAAVVDAVRAARGGPGGPRPGPVHLDVAFDDPLVPEGPSASAPPVAPAPAAALVPGPEPRPAPPRHLLAGDLLAPAGRTVVIAGAGAGDAARRLAEDAGWPLLAEPSSGARSGPNAIPGYRLLLDVEHLGRRVERVIAFGRPTLSRPVTRLLARPEVEVVHVVSHPAEPGPERAVRRLVGMAVAPDLPGVGNDWLRAWQDAGSRAAAAVDAVLDAGPLNGPLLAREVAAATAPGDLLVAAASNAVRDLDLAAAPRATPRRVLANRGLSGIDGTLSTATGAALSTGARTRALVGDLAFLHDLNGLLLGPEDPVPHLQVVVLNDDGGGIFGLLEHGEPRHAAVHERLFGTPHGADLAALCDGIGVQHRRVDDLHGLRAALRDPQPGRSVLEVPASRSGLRRLHEMLRGAAALAVREVAT